MKESTTNKTPDSISFLMHISFDNTRRLLRNRYYFEYRGVQFKLIQNNPRKFPDSLLTIIPMNDEPAIEKAFSVAAEFLSALAWRNDAEIALWYSGGSGFRNVSLKTARPTIYSLSKIAHPGNSRGYDLGIIPHIKNDSQRIALALFREAKRIK